MYLVGEERSLKGVSGVLNSSEEIVLGKLSEAWEVSLSRNSIIVPPPQAHARERRSQALAFSKMVLPCGMTVCLHAQCWDSTSSSSLSPKSRRRRHQRRRSCGTWHLHDTQRHRRRVQRDDKYPEFNHSLRRPQSSTAVCPVLARPYYGLG